MTVHEVPPAATHGTSGRKRQCSQQERRERHNDVLATLHDALTIQHIEMLGIKTGWRCWEVGAGGPSVPMWLAQRVGSEGYVLVTDINVDLLHGLVEPPCEVRWHDIGTDPPPVAGFDLVHARLVLVHVQGRDKALAAMIGALRPGGWMFVEDVDFELQPLAAPDAIGPAQELANKIRQAIHEISAARKRPTAYGRTLPRLLRDAGLVEVEAKVSYSLASARFKAYQQRIVKNRREHLVSSGLATNEEIERHLADITAGRVDITTFPTVSAWARKPL